MRNMKDSGIEWIREIPEDWEVIKVKHIFNRKNEKAKLDNPVVLSLTRNGVKVRDISNNEGQLAESYYDYNPVSKGDLLLNPMDLYSGANCSVSNVEGVISPAYANLRAKNDNNPIYYDYYFKTQYWSMALFAHGKGVSFNNRWTLNNEILMNYFLPHPSLEEQQKIANYLDNKVKEIDNIISKTKETIEEYKKYKQSVITEAVTKGLNPNVEMKDSGIEWIGEIPKDWNIIRLRFLCDICTGNKDTINKDENGLYPFYVRSPKVEKINSYSFDGEAILTAGDGVGAGKVFHYVNEKFDYHQRVYNLHNFSKNINPKLLYFYLKENFYKEIEKGNAKSTVDSIRLNMLQNFPVIIPNKQQEDIVKYLDEKCNEINKLISKKEQLIFELEQYKKSLIYECVTGKREVK